MRFGEEWVQKEIDRLTAESKKTLLMEDENGFWTYQGMADLLKRHNLISGIIDEVTAPEFKLIPWKNIPEFSLRPYQQQALDSLLQNRHSHVEIATGAGKTNVIISLLKKTGLRCVVCTPSKSIAEQIYNEASYLLGKEKVGLFGAGKKQVGKQFLISVGKSLSLVEGEAAEEFKQYDVFIADESHSLPQQMLEKVCHGLLAHCPYRWFVSATQERNDGRDLMLEAIIGKQVFEYSIQQAQAEGYLAKIDTMIIDIESKSKYQNKDNVVKMNQEHFYKNDGIAKIISQMVNQQVKKGMPVLVLVDEHGQEELLKKRLQVEYAYACGDSDVTSICDDFNQGKILCVVGTSAVSTGTNFLPVRLTINWQANKAGTKVKQGAIGRSTRVHKETGKTSCKIVDFRVTNVPLLKRHADERAKYYEQVGPVQHVHSSKMGVQ